MKKIKSSNKDISQTKVSEPLVCEPEVLEKDSEPEVCPADGEIVVDSIVEDAQAAFGDEEAEIVPALPEDIVPEVVEEVSVVDEVPEVLGPEEPAPKGTEVVPYDPLQAYLREIRAYAPLSREEEHDLAQRYHHNKDLDAAYKLVTSNLWLVVKIARDYEKAARSILDLVQEGNMGLMEAVKNFDPYRGVRFPSYAVWWIKAYIVRFVIANWRLVKIGTTQAQRKLFFNLRKEKERLEREGFYPGPRLLAERLNVKPSDVVEMEQRLSGADVSVDTTVQPDSETTLLSILPTDESTAEELLGQKQIKAMLEKGMQEFASTLKPNELIIFNQRMLGEDKATLKDIAEKLDISQERVRQIENRLRDKLKEFLQTNYGQAIENLEF